MCSVINAFMQYVCIQCFIQKIKIKKRIFLEKIVGTYLVGVLEYACSSSQFLSYLFGPFLQN